MLCGIIYDPLSLLSEKGDPSFLCSPIALFHITSSAIIALSSSYMSSCPSLSSLWASWKQRSYLTYPWVFKHLAYCYMFIELHCTNYLWCPNLEGERKSLYNSNSSQALSRITVILKENHKCVKLLSVCIRISWNNTSDINKWT